MHQSVRKVEGAFFRNSIDMDGVRLYLDDLVEIGSLIQEHFCIEKIQVDDYEIDTLNDLYKVKNKVDRGKIKGFYIKSDGINCYIRAGMSGNVTVIRLNDNIKCFGVMYRIYLFILKRKSNFLYKIGEFILGIIVLFIGWFSGINDINFFSALTVAIFASFFVAFLLFFPLKWVIIVAADRANPRFFDRNKDRILTGLVVATLVLVGKQILEYFLNIPP